MYIILLQKWWLFWMADDIPNMVDRGPCKGYFHCVGFWGKWIELHPRQPFMMAKNILI